MLGGWGIMGFLLGGRFDSQAVLRGRESFWTFVDQKMRRNLRSEYERGHGLRTKECPD